MWDFSSSWKQRGTGFELLHRLWRRRRDLDRTTKPASSRRVRTRALGPSVDWLIPVGSTGGKQHLATLQTVPVVVFERIHAWGARSPHLNVLEYAAFTDLTFHFAADRADKVGGRQSREQDLKRHRRSCSLAMAVRTTCGRSRLEERCIHLSAHPRWKITRMI